MSDNTEIRANFADIKAGDNSTSGHSSDSAGYKFYTPE